MIYEAENQTTRELICTDSFKVLYNNVKLYSRMEAHNHGKCHDWTVTKDGQYFMTLNFSKEAEA